MSQLSISKRGSRSNILRFIYVFNYLFIYFMRHDEIEGCMKDSDEDGEAMGGWVGGGGWRGGMGAMRW